MTKFEECINYIKKRYMKTGLLLMLIGFVLLIIGIVKRIKNIEQGVREDYARRQSEQEDKSAGERT